MMEGRATDIRSATVGNALSHRKLVRRGGRGPTSHAMAFQQREAAADLAAILTSQRSLQKLLAFRQKRHADVALPLHSIFHLGDVQKGAGREAVPMFLVLRPLQILVPPRIRLSCRPFSQIFDRSRRQERSGVSGGSGLQCAPRGTSVPRPVVY